MRIIFKLLIISSFIKGQSINNQNNSPLHVLSTIKPNDEVAFIKTFNPDWVQSLKLKLPCDSIPVPKRTMRLPNAPRDYRNGIHRGIDFFANWGTPVKSVADGIVIRADLEFEEVPADFREQLLKTSSKVGHTPSDIFNSVLLGQAIFIDHGFNLVPGFRSITIYAHLSSIEDTIKPGVKILSGQVIGRSGNTGMRESTLGTKSGSHLHWEMILMKDHEEIYLGKDLQNPDLYNMLNLIFE
jgi:murein DD-endopeptidase MepM/ murein hydrolase activator NlpD